MVKDFARRLRAAAFRWRMRGLKEPDFSGKRVLIVAPHPDDEVLGCGGLIARLCAVGNPPTVLILTNGEASHRGCCDTAEATIVAERRKLTRKAAQRLGLPERNILLGNLPDGRIGDAESLPEVVDDLQPEVVLVPHSGEGWPDHVNAAELARRWLRESGRRAEVYEYCVWFWYYNARVADWSAGRCMRLTAEETAAKREASRIYLEALAPCGRPWSGQLPCAFVAPTQAPTELYFVSK